jgi:protein-L-isoaspartate(D-aspartate) O-methyltransferase
MNDDLIAQLQQEHIITDEAIASALRTVDRRDFTAAPYTADADQDCPLPIGHGQTISQPRTVAFMLSLLDVKPGHRVLDVGAGSGWTAALLSELVGDNGVVIGVERIPQLASFARKNLIGYEYEQTQIIESCGDLGAPAYAPYDRILVSAATNSLPNELIAQLSDGGVLVIPISNALWCVTKSTDHEVSVVRYPGFSFVPLISQ